MAVLARGWVDPAFIMKGRAHYWEGHLALTYTAGMDLTTCDFLQITTRFDARGGRMEFSFFFFFWVISLELVERHRAWSARTAWSIRYLCL